MSKSDWNEQLRHEAEANRADKVHDQTAACQANDLKGLLHTIVDQLSEADRRHSDALRQMQDKLAHMGREAQTMRACVPSQFSAAFERVDAGMAERAASVADVSDSHGHVPAAAHHVEAPVSAPAPAPTWSSHKPSEPPMALRSAGDQTAQSAKRREEEASRAQGGIDTFDVIESLPGNVANPWDQDAADALAGIYDSGDTGFEPATSLVEPSAKHAGSFSPVTLTGLAPHTALVGSAAGNADRSWLEARFTDISNHIEAQIKDIHHDQSFFALGQRLDQFERQFSTAIEGVATRGDVEGIRLIEAHMSEISGHLESAHQQLTRIEAIEAQLTGLADKLGDVHRAAMATEGPDSAAFHAHEPMPAIDVHAVAKEAVQQAAAHFAEIEPHPQTVEGLNEVRNMMHRLMSDNRQAEENTTALLDTLQQAMIRLLDRVDAMELSHHQNTLGQTVPQDYLRDTPRFDDDNPHHQLHANAGTLDAAVAAVANRNTAQQTDFHEDDRMASHSPSRASARDAEPVSEVRDVAQGPERIRQDFIADARRAKMRLAAENSGQPAAADSVVKRPEATDKPAATKAAPGTPAATASKATAKKEQAKGSSIMSPRVMVVTIAAILAVGGGCWLYPFGEETPVSTLKPLPAPSATKAAKTKDAAKSKEANSATPNAPKGDGVARAVEGGDTAVPTNPEAQPEVPKKDGETRGEIVSPDGNEIAADSDVLPLSGVAVDNGRTLSPAELARAKRQHAMAAMSGRLGQAAAQNSALAMPAALMPSFDGSSANSNGHSQDSKGGITSSPLDLPPASVGPLSLRLAAANGDPSAEFEVGARLAEGKGTDQNFKDAAKWYQRSASRGFVQSQYRLGTLYERGLGVKADPARAQDWYKRAAEQGNVKAMHNLAVLSANQNKSAPDYPEAAKWFTAAAERGLSDSQFNLAVLHENGLGVPQDLKQAYKWVSLAARSGDKEAVRRRDLLKGKLTVEDLNQAEAQTAGFRSKAPDPMANDARTAGEAWKKNPTNGVNG